MQIWFARCRLKKKHKQEQIKTCLLQHQGDVSSNFIVIKVMTLNGKRRQQPCVNLQYAAISTLNMLKNGVVGVYSTTSPQSTKSLPFLYNFNFFNNEKLWKKQLWTLAYILVVQTIISLLGFIFWCGPIEFPHFLTK